MACDVVTGSALVKLTSGRTEVVTVERLADLREAGLVVWSVFVVRRRRDNRDSGLCCRCRRRCDTVTG